MEHTADTHYNSALKTFITKLTLGNTVVHSRMVLLIPLPILEQESPDSLAGAHCLRASKILDFYHRVKRIILTGTRCRKEVPRTKYYFRDECH